MESRVEPPPFLGLPRKLVSSPNMEVHPRPFGRRLSFWKVGVWLLLAGSMGNREFPRWCEMDLVGRLLHSTALWPSVCQAPNKKGKSGTPKPCPPRLGFVALGPVKEGDQHAHGIGTFTKTQGAIVRIIHRAEKTITAFPTRKTVFSVNPWLKRALSRSCFAF